ncbi:MAG: VOC family protein, partial [Candidatus Korarchaeota archaeon]|nr:VOC family protein [Candidatus Korarchaeota archaeon]NIU85122.1 VOC family protein [Candidatus Thorarchaeota archaeon]NIW15086.1 VOC family protein [Candidatus Thorarchaeota archaeon]NIW53096.1 VOC family protein [Candidatus Korarchaeota archaeon]
GIQEIKEKFEEDQPPWRGAMISFEVKNIEKTKVELENKGVRFTTDIIELEGVKIAKCEDPDGNPLEIHERT